MAISPASVLRLAESLLPETHAASRAIVLRARRIFALACLADTPQFIADGCFRVTEWEPAHVVRFLRTHPPATHNEDVAALRAQVMAESDERMYEAIVYLRGALRSKGATFGTMRFYDALRPRPTLHPTYEEDMGAGRPRLRALGLSA